MVDCPPCLSAVHSRFAPTSPEPSHNTYPQDDGAENERAVIALKEVCWFAYPPPSLQPSCPILKVIEEIDVPLFVDELIVTFVIPP